jgi:carbon-monoxide dehydrogenase medium subunit
VRVGALARHADVEGDEAAHAVQPLLREALRLVAHPVIRNRGTTVGSLAHADPAAEMTAVLTLLQGSVDAASLRGTRTIAADEFFAGPLESTLQPDELALSAWFPRLVEHSGVTFEEVARRHGDYALCGVAAMVRLDADLRVAAAGAAYISMAPTPVRIDLSEAVAGASYDGADWAAAAAHAQGQLDPEPDIHASAEYRLHLAGILTRRALARAAGRGAEGAE